MRHSKIHIENVEIGIEKISMILVDDLKCLCCANILKKGTDVNEVAGPARDKLSKNRIYVSDGRGTHKVKKSSFRRCAGLIK